MDALKPASWSSAVARAAATPPFLFARNGKLELQLLELTAERARASIAEVPPRGSAAVLSATACARSPLSVLPMMA